MNVRAIVCLPVRVALAALDVAAGPKTEPVDFRSTTGERVRL